MRRRRTSNLGPSWGAAELTIANRAGELRKKSEQKMRLWSDLFAPRVPEDCFNTQPVKELGDWIEEWEGYTSAKRAYCKSGSDVRPDH